MINIFDCSIIEVKPFIDHKLYRIFFTLMTFIIKKITRMTQLLLRYLKAAIILVLFFSSIIGKAQWSELGGVNGLAANQYIYTLCSDSIGNIYAAGNFTNDSGKNYVAKWDGVKWSELGGKNTLASTGYIQNLCFDKEGNLYASGAISKKSGGLYIAKWDGKNWSKVTMQNGFSFDCILNGLCTDNSGNIYTTTCLYNGLINYYVAKWEKSTGVWSELKGINALAANNQIEDLCIDKSGNIYAAGKFTNTKGKRYVAKWDGKNWTELGGLNGLAADSTIRTIYADVSGNVYAGGSFSDSNGKRYTVKWDVITNNWSKLGQMDGNLKYGDIGFISGDNSGNIYVSGAMREDTSNNYFVDKWNGTSWSEMGASFFGGGGSVFSTCLDSKGFLYAGGAFLNAYNNSFVAVYNPTTTPVTLTSFTTTKKDNNVLLNWQTATEINTAYFNIQRSTNGKDFATVGSVNAKGAGSYNYTDPAPPPPKGGIWHYRLQVVDKDGALSYSEVRELTIVNFQLSIAPNPAKDIVNLSSKGMQHISITDNTGKIVMNKTLDNTDNTSINIANLAKGVYYISVKDNAGKVHSGKMVVE